MSKTLIEAYPDPTVDEMQEMRKQTGWSIEDCKTNFFKERDRRMLCDMWDDVQKLKLASKTGLSPFMFGLE